MRSIYLTLLITVIAGCIAIREPKVITEGTLGEGTYGTALPFLESTNSPPTIAVWNCGRIDIETKPYKTPIQWQTLLSWPDDCLDVNVYGTNDNFYAGFRVYAKGTNIYLSTYPQIFKFERGTTGHLILKEVKQSDNPHPSSEATTKPGAPQ